MCFFLIALSKRLACVPRRATGSYLGNARESTCRDYALRRFYRGRVDTG
jgi:hypothetical protein